MTDERRIPPYLKPISAKPARPPLPISELQALPWQRTLFASTSGSLLVVLQVDGLSESEFVEVLSEAHAKYVIDLRPVPRFDVGTLTRRAAFALFAHVGSKYVDLPGRMGVTDRRDSRLNPQILAEQIRALLSIRPNEIVEGPIIFLVEAQHFSDEYVTTLADTLQSLRPGGWDLLKIPMPGTLVSGHRSTKPAHRRMVFISHANPEDNEFAKWLGVQLSLAGYLVWSDVTSLIGGETFWDSIEDAIRIHAAKVIVVVSRASQHKNGVLDEVNLAVAVERATGADGFVLPVRLDDIPFDEVRANLARKNIVDFSKNWATAFATVLKVLARDGVPEAGVNAKSVAAWSRNQMERRDQVIRVTETLNSNWLTIRSLPSSVYVHPTNPGPEDQNNLLCTHPHVLIRDHAVVFGSRISSEQIGVEWKLDSVLRDGVSAPDNLNARQVSNVVTNLLRQAWSTYAVSKGLLPYTLSSNAVAWYAPSGLVEGDNVGFRDSKGKSRRKYVVGYSEKHNVFWHFALEARPTLARHNRFALVSHVVFTTDGRSKLPTQAKLHSLRRQFCKNWWNDRWRDLTIAYLTWLFDGKAEANLAGQFGGELWVETQPAVFRCPASVPDSKDQERYDRAIQELEWEDLDVAEDAADSEDDEDSSDDE